VSTAPVKKLTSAVVLLVEDDLEDQALTRRAFQKSAFQAELKIVSDGQQALDYLLQEGAYADPVHAPRPDLVLLDLNMPNVDGHGVLERMRSHIDLQGIPVVVLTTSDQPRDVQRCYEMGCNSFITKPSDISAFVNVLEQLECYWFDLVTLPGR